MKFNVNDEVRVKLTSFGRSIHRLQWEAREQSVRELLGAYEPPIEDSEGWSTWQLWELMHSFGAHCFNGCIIPFEMQIDIITRGEKP
jgi:hypothetical protein